MAKDLMGWAAEQPDWVKDSLRRIAVAADHTVEQADADCILDNVRATARAGSSVHPITSIDASHLGGGSGETRRTVLAQLGPVQNIDRLAGGQKLRMAPVGITLVYGENGSGKSGYTRIAKRLCRSLTADQLRGNVFEASAGPMRVQVRYQVGDDPVTDIEWDPATPAPSQLRQLSVFDSHNARLYVDSENRIAYLPRELAILEHHGELCDQMTEKFLADEKVLAPRLRVPLPAGYTQGGSVSVTLAKLDPKAPSLPSEDDLRKLSELSEIELAELAQLEVDLAADPVALAAMRGRAAALLNRVGVVLGKLREGLSETVGETIALARRELDQAAEAERIVASASFADEPVANVGSPAWRILFEAARAFAAAGAEAPPERLPEATGDLCLLCLEPLTSPGAARLARFNDFVSGEATKRADGARNALKALLEQVAQVKVPEVAVVEDSLAGYGQLDATRANIVAEIIRIFGDFESRRAALLDESANPAPAPNVTALSATVTAELARLEEEAASLRQSASHTETLDAMRARLAELKDRAKLANDLETVLQRLRDVTEQRSLTSCRTQVATRPISKQITALRKQLVTEELERRIAEEIGLLDLTHLPFKVSDSSSGGKSLFSVGLQGAGAVKNNQVLSEGEQRALALACFLAEIGGDDARYGIIVDDPVSSLDHLRIRKVAQRLVAEAKKGRQVIIFTHNLVFFNEVVSEAARAGDAAPLIKSVVAKTQSEGFGVVRENSAPWGADLNARIEMLRKRAKELKAVTDFDTDEYRRHAKDFYSDLRETWERTVEEILLAKTVVRLVPDVKTTSLREVTVTDEDYRTIFFAMKRTSERSGHDMSAGRDIPQPSPKEMEADFKVLDDFKIGLVKRRREISAVRSALENPAGATLL
ncbi:AAA family ATPase [Paracoccus sp. CPCC 101403]|uniref:AAA family ATPase n=1 Tax=Paracoccus broussonetiae TaxID=3075834 RepID=A0ABU3EJE1_9RHOB|nr:AAA family ATPase [Paracoccus sp. CPCC 101403]MDT1064369.1 AAA family ATPase [Paracoccus sp. CPCC 101403]